jgi:hypothetical protein
MLFLSWRTDVQFAELLTGSLVRLVGSTFLPAHVDGTNTAWWIQEDATFVLLAHDTSADRPFGYANRTAQRCLEYDWDEFVEMPSRLSAAAPNREERRQFMDGVLARATSTTTEGCGSHVRSTRSAAIGPRSRDGTRGSRRTAARSRRRQFSVARHSARVLVLRYLFLHAADKADNEGQDGHVRVRIL